jgi:hypothetical protein
MTITKLEKPDWSAFFERASRILLGQRTDIEIVSHAFGNQFGAAGLPLMGIVYDPGNEIIEVILDGFDHIVYRPSLVYFDEGPGLQMVLQIIADDGVSRIIRMRDPLMLPGSKPRR